MHDFSRAAVHEGRYVVNELRGMEKESEEQKGEEEAGWDILETLLMRVVEKSILAGGKFWECVWRDFGRGWYGFEGRGVEEGGILAFLHIPVYK